MHARFHLFPPFSKFSIMAESVYATCPPSPDVLRTTNNCNVVSVYDVIGGPYISLCVSSSQVAIHRRFPIDRATDRYTYSLLTRLCLRAIKPDAGRFVDGRRVFFSFFPPFLFSPSPAAEETRLTADGSFVGKFFENWKWTTIEEDYDRPDLERF